MRRGRSAGARPAVEKGAGWALVTAAAGAAARPHGLFLRYDPALRPACAQQATGGLFPPSGILVYRPERSFQP